MPIITYAETIHLKDGTVIQGRILSTTENFFGIKTETDVITIAKKDIVKIEDNKDEERQKSTAAVMDLTAEQGVSAGTAKALSDYLRVQLVNTEKYDIVTRENMDEILEEQKFQLSGCTSRECVVQVGQLLGVRKIFVGVVTKVGATYIVTLKIIDVESGKIGKAETEECAKCEEDALLISMRNITNKIIGLKVKAEIAPKITKSAEEIIWQEDNSTMIFVPAGEFIMGSDSGEDNEKPSHRINLDAYYIDKYEVTNEQYAKFLNKWTYDRAKDGHLMIYEHVWGVKKVSGPFETLQKWQPSPGYEKYPVVNVTWYGANQYAKWTGKRLPTEAEWEKACRAGSTTKYCFGNNETALEEYAWYYKNSGSKTHPVGEKKPNAWGIYDMHGNVYEWCSDWYGRNYYEGYPYRDPQGPLDGLSHIIRGGSWDSIAWYCFSTYRCGDRPGYGWYACGFRCVVSASALPK